jgi:hypothetical protein
MNRTFGSLLYRSRSIFDGSERNADRFTQSSARSVQKTGRFDRNFFGIDEASFGRTIASIDLTALLRRTRGAIVRSCKAIVPPIEVSLDLHESMVVLSIASPRFPIGSPGTVERAHRLHESTVRDGGDSIGRTIASHRRPIASTETSRAIVRT